MTRKKQTPWFLIGLAATAACLALLYFLKSHNPSMMESMQQPATGLDTTTEEPTKKKAGECCKPEAIVYEVTDPCCVDYIKNCEEPCVIKFSAQWCGACNHLASYYEDVAKEFNGKVTFYSIDCDNPTVMQKAEEEHLAKGAVTSLPTIVFLQKGKVHEQKIGAMPKDMLIAEVKSSFGL